MRESPSVAATQHIPNWHIKADYVESCNCDYGCPCNFTGFPTYGFCRDLLLFHIREGNYGDNIDLNGLEVIYAGSWPKAIHEGNFGLDAIGVGILQLPFSLAIVILGPIAGIIAAKHGATKLLIPSALTILLSFMLLTFLHSTPEQVGINLIFFGIGSGLIVTLDAIIILFIPKILCVLLLPFESFKRIHFPIAMLKD